MTKLLACKDLGYNAPMTTSARQEQINDGPIVLFDATCVLCSANARFILTHDRAAQFRLASMQSEIGQALYRKHGMDPDDPVSLLVVEGDRMRRDSDAVLSIYETLGYPWPLSPVRSTGQLLDGPRAVQGPHPVRDAAGRS